MNKSLKTIVTTLCCLALYVGVQAQNYEGTFKKTNFNCPINGTTEGYLHTPDGKRIDIASYIPLSDGDYVEVSEHSWGTKNCDGKSFKIYFVKDASLASAKGARPYRMSKTAIAYAQDNGLQYIVNQEFTEIPQYEVVTRGNSSAGGTAISSTGSKLTPQQAEEALAHHNKARADVGVAPLSWSAELSRYAQEWADYLANNYGCKMAHRSELGRKDQKYGENIFWGSGRVYTALDASKSWYNEIKDFRNAPIGNSSGPVTGHYSQMVWRNTTEVGMGVARCPNGNYIIVANYNPAGNFIGQKAY